MGEGSLYSLQFRNIPPQEFQIFPPVLQGIAYNMAYEPLLQVHVIFMIKKGHLRFKHPKFGQMSASLGFFCPESGTEAVDLAKGRCSGL